MREKLSESFSNEVQKSVNTLFLTADHGYTLFNELREKHPNNFINVGIMEQAMIGIATGLSIKGFSPVVYGLASFIPMKVVEQIKLMICLPNIPIKIIGDGAGLVYSHLGNSHTSINDLAMITSMPNIHIYTPGDIHEMEVCLNEFYSLKSPAYLRVGKMDNPPILSELKNIQTNNYFTNKTQSSICIVSMGSMNGISSLIAKEENMSHISFIKIKPINKSAIEKLSSFKKIIVIEEHHAIGGLNSILINEFICNNIPIPEIIHFCLKDKFTDQIGSYQYLLSLHGISFEILKKKIKEITNV